MKYLFVFLFLIIASPAFAAAPTYDIDHGHTRIFFRVNHGGFSDLIGEFKEYEGYFTFDEMSPEASKADVTLKVGSIQTSSPELDKKLMGEEFFDEEKYPTITFKSTKVTKSSPNTGTLEGILTMHGVSKPLAFEVTLNKSGDFMGTYKAGFSAVATVKRSDFGLDKYVPLVSDEVMIDIEAEATRRDVTPVKKP